MSRRALRYALPKQTSKPRPLLDDEALMRKHYAKRTRFSKQSHVTHHVRALKGETKDGRIIRRGKPRPKGWKPQ